MSDWSWTDHVFASEYMGNFEQPPTSAEDLKAAYDRVFNSFPTMWKNQGSMGGWVAIDNPVLAPQFTATELAAPGTIDTNALTDLGWTKYMSKDLWYRRTLTPEWREGVRKRLATGLDDAPVLPCTLTATANTGRRLLGR